MRSPVLLVLVLALELVVSSAPAQWIHNGYTPPTAPAAQDIPWTNGLPDLTNSLVAFTNQIAARTNELAPIDDWTNTITAWTNGVPPWTNEVAQWTNQTGNQLADTGNWTNSLNSWTNQAAQWTNQVENWTNEIAGWTNQVGGWTNAAASNDAAIAAYISSNITVAISFAIGAKNETWTNDPGWPLRHIPSDWTSVTVTNINDVHTVGGGQLIFDIEARSNANVSGYSILKQKLTATPNVLINSNLASPSVITGGWSMVLVPSPAGATTGGVDALCGEIRARRDP